jgi:hypothetical protein
VTEQNGSKRGVWEVDFRTALESKDVHATEKVVASSSGRAIAQAKQFHPPKDGAELVITRVQMVNVLS